MKPLSMPSLLIISLILAGSLAHSEVKLPTLFSNHMVLQREMPIHIWGEAAPGEQVAISLQDSTASATADELGRWSIYLPALPAGGPFTLSVHASNTLQFEDIFIGDLWMASGQSNMEIPLKGYNPATQIQDSTAEIAGANHPQIRLFLVQHDVSDYPLEDVKAAAGWSQCTPESAANFSAVAYFFARALQQKQHVAIGLIDSTWGGTPAEAWTSLDTLGNDTSLMPVFATRADWMDREMTEERLVRLDAETKAQGKVPPRRYWHPDPVSWRPATLYNAMIAPLTRLPIRGVIWYQGEANSAPQMAPLYSHLFPALIQDWRTQWRQPDLPFLFVQLSAYGNNPTDNWGLIRDAQRRTLHLVNTGMAVTIDIGNEHNVHPANKQAVGDRLALLARKIVYKENLVSSGPLFRYAYPVGGSMHVLFDNADGLTSNSSPESFEVAGADGVFVSGTAKIEGNMIIVSSPTVPDPQYVRYAWSNYPPEDHPANLYNGAGLPAATFTSYPMP
jgi:sialate O-acetylesterase